MVVVAGWTGGRDGQNRREEKIKDPGRGEERMEGEEETEGE